MGERKQHPRTNYIKEIAFSSFHKIRKEPSNQSQIRKEPSNQSQTGFKEIKTGHQVPTTEEGNQHRCRF